MAKLPESADGGFRQFPSFMFLREKKRMRTIAAVSITLVVGVSCGIKETGVAVNPMMDGVWVSTGMTDGVLEENPGMMTVFIYPDSFDWYGGDPARVRTSLALYDGNSPVMRLSVGDGYHVSHDPDRHWIIDGHLYTSHDKDGVMVVMKDGSTLFRYPAQERIVGIVVENDHVYTLCVHYGDVGFTYRRDGVSIISKYTGCVTGSLKKDGDKICFAYSSRTITENGDEMSYFMVRDAVEEQIMLPGTVDVLWDAVSFDGETCCIAYSSLTGEAFYYREDVMKKIGLPRFAKLQYASFIPGSCSRPCLEGVYETSSGKQLSALWIEADEYVSIDNSLSITCARFSDDGFGCVMNPLSDDSQGLIIWNGDVHLMPEGYRCMGSCPIRLSGLDMTVGLSSIRGGHPLVWRNGELDTLYVNGYISSMSEP